MKRCQLICAVDFAAISDVADDFGGGGHVEIEDGALVVPDETEAVRCYKLRRSERNRKRHSNDTSTFFGCSKKCLVCVIHPTRCLTIDKMRNFEKK